MGEVSLTDQITTSLADEGHIPTVSKADSGKPRKVHLDEKLKSLGVAYTLNGTIERSAQTLHARLHLDDHVRHASLWSYETTGSADDPITFDSAIGRSIAGVISCAYRRLGPQGLTDTELPVAVRSGLRPVRQS